MTGFFSDNFCPSGVKVQQLPGDPGAAAIAGVDQLLVVLPERVPAALWRKVPQGAKLKSLLSRKRPGRVPAVSSRLANKRQTAVHIGQLASGKPCFERLTFARKLVAASAGEKAKSLGILVLGFADDERAELAGNLIAAALAAAFEMPRFGDEKPSGGLKSLRVMGLPERVDFSRTIAESHGNDLARWLTALPPNKLDAGTYAEVLKTLAADNGWQFKKYGPRELKKMGAGAFLAVAQGNADDSACIIRLRYRPGNAKAAPGLTLVGKGIIFDTGGNNLKPFNSMLDMHIDMGGSAAAVGTLLTLSELGSDLPVDCWLAITENRIGASAYKSQDVITAANGKTIQTIHTDAEGRMALADTLVFASADKPGVIIDYATLTGACMNATTTRYSGVFTNRPALHPLLKKAGVESGERVWPFPIGGEFLEELKAETADILQCSPGGGGDHILAASFLNEFVDPDIAWVHVDLSAAKRKGGLAHIPSDITGFGIRFTTQLVLDKAITDAESLARLASDS